MKKRLAVILMILITFFMCTEAVTVNAASLGELNKSITQKRAELNKGKSKESSLAAQVSSLEQQIYSVQSSIDQLETAIAESEVKLATLKKELAAAQAKVDDQNKNLSARLRNMYKNGTIGFLDVLLESHSFSEFLTNLDLVEKIYTGDKEVLAELEAAYDEIDTKKKEVETLQANLEESKQLAETEKSNLEADRATVAKQKQEIAASNEETARMLDQQEAEAKALAAKMAASNSVSKSTTSTYSGGTFAWPTPGYSTITSPYGWRNCPFHGREFHAAVDIAAPSGARVVSAASGKVYRAGWYGGFGYNVIIDHGGGMTTWYNHMSSISVSRGQTVSKGQQVGRVGSTGSSTGPHLDYRVFINGSSRNPMSYY